MIPDSSYMIPYFYYCIPDSYKWFHILTTKFRIPTNGLRISAKGSGFPLVDSYSQMISHLYICISNCVEYLDKEQSYKNSTKEVILSF